LTGAGAWTELSRPSKLRTCVGCRREAEKSSFVRVCCSGAGAVVVDDTGKLPGRGAYICRSAECLRKALKGSRLARALRGRVDERLVSVLTSIVAGETDEGCTGVK